MLACDWSINSAHVGVVCPVLRAAQLWFLKSVSRHLKSRSTKSLLIFATTNFKQVKIRSKNVLKLPY